MNNDHAQILIDTLTDVLKELKRIADQLEKWGNGSHDYPFPVEIGEPTVKVKGELRTINAGKDY